MTDAMTGLSHRQRDCVVRFLNWRMDMGDERGHFAEIFSKNPLDVWINLK